MVKTQKTTGYEWYAVGDNFEYFSQGYDIVLCGNVPCFEGDEARKAFDDLQYTEAIRFYDGYSNHIEGVSVIEKISAEDVDNDPQGDVYIVAKDFSWTYVRTHHGDHCGPYFCKLK